MKKLILALLLVLLCVGVAFADETAVTATVANATLVDGAVSGSYYYKVYFTGDHFQMAFSGDPDADAPGENDEITDETPAKWYEHDANGPFLLTYPPAGEEDNPSDALFYRVSESDPWQKIVFHYDRTKLVKNADFLTNAEDDVPTALMQDYTLSWQDLGADAYTIRLRLPNGIGYNFGRYNGETGFSLSDADVAEYGGPERFTGFVGDYEFWVVAMVNGEYRESAHKTFTLEAPEAGDIQFWCAAQDENGAISMRLNEWFDLEARIADPEDLEDVVFVIGDQISHEGWEEDGYADCHWVANNERQKEYTYNAYVRAKYYGQDEWVYSHIIPVTVTMDQQIEGALSWTVTSGTTLARDDMFVIDVNNIGADFYDMYVQDPETWERIADSHWVWAAEGDTTTVRLPLVALEPGEYDVHVYAAKYAAPSKYSNETIHITVTDPVSENPLLISMKDSYTTGEFLRMAAVYTNPEAVEEFYLDVEILNARGRSIYGNQAWNNMFWDEGTKLWGTGDYTLQVTAWGRNGQEEYRSLAHAEFGFSVTAEYDDIAVTLPENLPDELHSGEGLSFTVLKPENADQYYVDVWVDAPYNDYGVDLVEVDGLTADSFDVNLSAEDMENTLSVVYVYVEAVGVNREASFAYKIIPYVHAADEGAVLTLSGLEEDGTAPVGRNLRVRVSPTGEAEIRTIRLYDGNGLWNDEGMDEDGSWTRDILFDSANDYQVFAMITYDDWLDEYNELDYDPRAWVYTNTVQLTATSVGNVGDFTFDLSKNEAVRGEYLEITYGDAQNANFYWTDVERYNDAGYWEWVDSYAYLDTQMNQGGTALLPTAQLKEGRYHLRGAARGEGYVGKWLSWSEELSISEPENEENPVHLFVTPTEIQTGGDMQVSAYANGADWIDIFWDHENNEGWWDSRESSFARTDSPYWSSGEYKLVAQAWYPLEEPDENGNDHYPVESDAITVTVTAPDGTVNIPMAELPAYLAEGEGLTVSVEAVEGSDWQNISLEIENEDGFRWRDDRQFYWEGTEAEITWDMLAEHEIHAGQRLLLRANAGKRGTQVNGWEAWIPVVYPQDDALQATIAFEGVEGDTLDALASQDIRVIITMNDRVPQTYTYTWGEGEDEQTIEITERDVIDVVWFFDGNQFRQDHEGPDDGGLTYTTDVNFNNPGTYPIYARVTFTGWDDAWNGQGIDPRRWYTTNVITVNVDAYGEVPPFGFSLNTDEVIRGDVVIVNYDAAEHAEEYWLDYERLNEAGDGWKDFRGGIAHADAQSGQAATAYLNTFMMEPGTYRLRAAARAEGYTGHWMDMEEESLILTVKEPELQEGESPVRVFVDATEIQTGDEIEFWGFATGADWIDIYWDYENNRGWHNSNGGGDAFDRRMGYWGADNNQVRAVAWYPLEEPDEDGNDHYPVESDPITITITAPNGTVQIPMADLPATLAEGEDLRVIISDMEGAEWQDISLQIQNEDGERWSDENGHFYWDDQWANEDGGLDVTIAWDMLKNYNIHAGQTLVLGTNAGMPGFQVEGWQRLIPVVEALGEDETPQAVIAFDSTEDDSVTVPIYRNLSFTVRGLDGRTPVRQEYTVTVKNDEGETEERLIVVQEEETIQTVSFFDGYNYRNHEGAEWDGAYHAGANFREARSYSVLAKVTYTPWNDEWSDLDFDPRVWYTTNALTVTAEAYGQVGEFTYQLERDSASRGENVVVTYTASENANEYWLDVEYYNEDDHSWDTVLHTGDLESEDGQGGTSVLATAPLDPGLYRVWGYARAHEGYTAYGAGYTQFTVTEPTQPNGTVKLSVYPATVPAGGEYTLSAYAPGADWVDVYKNFDYDTNNWWENWGGDSFTATRSEYWNPGVYSLVAKAWFPEYDENGDPVIDENTGFPRHSFILSDPVTLTVTAADTIDVPVPELPGALPTGDGLEIRQSVPEGVEWFELAVDVQNEDGGRWRPDPFTYNWNGADEEITADIPWSLMEAQGLHDGQTLIVKTSGGARGRMVDCWEVRIPIVKAASDDVVLTVSGLESDGTALVNKDITLRFEAADGRDIQRIIVYNGNNFWNEDGGDWDGAYERSVGFGEPGVYTLYAQVTLDQWPDGYTGEGDPRTWVYTNTVTVNVTAAGQVGEFGFSLSTDSVERPGDIDVTYTASANAMHYWVDVDRFNLDWQSWEHMTHTADLNTEPGGSGTAKLSTATLPAGRYRAWAYAQGWDYTIRGAGYVWFTVTEPDLAEGTVLLNASSTDIVTGERIHITGYAPGADWIDVYYDDGNYDWWNSWGGDSFSDDTTPYWGVGDYQMVAVARYAQRDENGEFVKDYNENGDEYVVLRKSEQSEPIAMHVTANATLDAPEVTPALPDTLGVNDRLEFSLTAPENFEWVDLNLVIGFNGWEWWPDGFHWQLRDGKSVNVSLALSDLPGYEPQAGEWVIVRVSGAAYGNQVNEWRVRIPIVSDTPAANLSFADSGDSAVTALVNSDIDVIVAPAQGEERPIKTVRFFDGYNFRDDEGPNQEDGTFRTRVSYGNLDRPIKLFALVTYDDWNDDWESDQREWLTTNVLIVNLTSNGTVAPFEVEEITPKVVTRGDIVRVTLTESDNAYAYWLNGDGFGYDWYWVDSENRVAEFSTMYLQPGTYRINATAYAPGLENYHTANVSFQVVDREDVPENGVKLMVSDRDIVLDQPIMLGVYAPGAKRVGVIVDGYSWHLDQDGNYQWGDGGDAWREQDRVIWSDRMDVGTHTIQGCAQFEDGGEWIKTEMEYVTVSSLGNLTFDLSDLPAFLVMEDGETPITMTIPLPEHAQSMNIRVGRRWEDANIEGGWGYEELERWDDVNYDKWFSISADRVNPGELLQIDLDAHGEGYAFVWKNVEIPMLSGIAQSGAAVILDIGNAEAQLYDEEVKFLVRPDEGRSIRGVRFYDGRGFWENGDWITHDNHGDWFEGDGSAFFFVHYNREDLGWHSAYAYVLLDGEDEPILTNVLPVYVTANGIIGSFDFVEGTPHEITVTRGEAITFQFTDAENAENYWLDAFDVAEWRSWDPRRVEDGNTVTMMTYQLPAGDYEVYGRAGASGWVWTDSMSHIVVHILDAQEGTVSLYVDQTDLLTQQMTGWQAYAPGASRLTVRGWNNEGEGHTSFSYSEDTDYLTGKNNFGDHEHTAYIQAIAEYPNGGMAASRITEINVTAPYGNLEDFTVRGSLYYEGGDLIFDIVPDARADWYRIYNVWDAEHNDYDNYEYRTPEDSAEWSNKHFAFYGTNAHMGVDVYQAAEGYNAIRTTAYIRPINTTNTLTLPRALTEIEDDAFAGNRAATHVIIPNGVITIGERAFEDCSFTTVEVPATVTSIGDYAFVYGNVTIYGYGGSEAQRFAADHGDLSFVQID